MINVPGDNRCMMWVLKDEDEDVLDFRSEVLEYILSDDFEIDAKDKLDEFAITNFLDRTM